MELIKFNNIKTLNASINKNGIYFYDISSVSRTTRFCKADLKGENISVISARTPSENLVAMNDDAYVYFNEESGAFGRLNKYNNYTSLPPVLDFIIKGKYIYTSEVCSGTHPFVMNRDGSNHREINHGNTIIIKEVDENYIYGFDYDNQRAIKYTKDTLKNMCEKDIIYNGTKIRYIERVTQINNFLYFSTSYDFYKCDKNFNNVEKLKDRIQISSEMINYKNHLLFISHATKELVLYNINTNSYEVLQGNVADKNLCVYNNDIYFSSHDDLMLCKLTNPINTFLKINNCIKKYDNGWVKVNGQLKQVNKIWTKIDGNLREV